MKLSQDLYFYPWQSTKENNCNSYVILGKTPTLIDPGHRKHFPQLLQEMAKDGIAKEKISLVVITHAHPDHMESVSEFKNNADVLITMSKEEETFLNEMSERYASALGMQNPELNPDFYLGEGELILGDDEWEIFITPGHSPGSLCLYYRKYQALFCGDLIFQGSVGRVDIPGGDKAALKSSIERMSKLAIEYIMPGHGNVIPGRDQVARNFKQIKYLLERMM